MITSFVLVCIHHHTFSANAFCNPSNSLIHVPSISISTRARAPFTKLDAVAKNREAELAKLADGLNVSPSKVRELLMGQRQKLTDTEAKAIHIDWLLNGDQNESKGNNESNGKKESKPAKPIRKVTKPSPVKSSGSKDSTLLTDIEFAKRSDLHSATKRALAEVLGLTSMTEIQAKTYDAALSGKDVLGRARTGTGKTIAFLLPAIERVLRSPEYDNDTDIGVLVISPTRELAMQIGDEAEKLLTFHEGMSVQTVYGGTKVARDISRLKSRLPTVLVATPGRLADLLKTASVGGRKFSQIMSRTPVAVLDETDQLLDQGFRREIQQILGYLPHSSKRQTLLFSATVPKELKLIMKETMKDDFIEVDCIQDGGQGEESTQTHIHVKQSHAIIPTTGQYVSSVIRVVQEAVKDDSGDNKIVVFFPTARMVSFFADLFNEVVKVPVMELHSKKSQSYRNKVSGQFRAATSGVLFTSDVSARGVDYPGVTHVVQFGMPSSRDQYVHRLGRTGRAGAEGKGWLVLGPFESLFLGELKNIDVPKNPALIDLLNKTTKDETDDLLLELLERVQNGDQILVKSGEGAYQAFLGYYIGQMKRMKMNRKESLVDVANEFSSAMGFRSPPVLGKNMVGKMGLKNVVGLTVSNQPVDRGNSNKPPSKFGRRDTRAEPSTRDRRSRPKRR
eukprot:CAMPEP_0172300926 /NCGR_PEP_ID=MMETSP1058-20130122/2922_1 /TAXON_ID=83371 /ORGANISM="Detonula confervacea, Strain CCMP 353" /LENGTH=676 /DNA_ID=CAMNT_0013010875 /DNA_START=1 /DNA_END=2031 /DNA_ORIENTATION=-